MNLSTSNRPTARSPIDAEDHRPVEERPEGWWIRDGDDLVDLVRSIAVRAAGLTPAELRIAELRLRGLQRKAISTQLCRSLHTIDHHLKSVRRKIGGDSSAALFAFVVDVLNASRAVDDPGGDPEGRSGSDDG